MGVRRFGRVNWLGMYTLAQREIQRFTSIWSQTLLAPIVTAGLFMAVFVLAFGAGRGDILGVPFAHFLAPGILMMAIVQNAFTNTSSSIVISKIQGNIIDTLMPPLSPLELVIGFMIGGIARGIVVAVAIAVCMFPVLGLGVAHPLWAAVFVLLGSALMSIVGLLAGVLSNKFDQLGAITNFVITPLAFLSGTFYSIQSLPPTFQTVAHFNPVFYLIDGLRHGVLGRSDGPPAIGALIVLATCLALGLLAWRWFETGFRMKT
ncbi:MAG: ABC transporter permease [Rhodobacteraceae bacterium]|nr:ABC transporter permease [Paracoccaceae bacterium]